MTYAPATERQLAFLDDLVASRDIPEALSAEYIAQRAVIDLKKASALISTFLQYPTVAPRPVGAGVVLDAVTQEQRKLYGELIEALGKVPQSKYAIPVSELMTDLLKDKVHGDLVFLEVREYKKRLFMKKLFGSVGAFTRVRPKVEDALTFIRIIERDPYKYARLFAEHYKCCGKCGAELTDPRSRELLLGPECRKAFGFVK